MPEETKQDKKTIDEELQELNARILKLTAGTFSVQPVIPTALYPIIPESLWNYFGMIGGFQRNQQRAINVKGRVGWFVCQKSHGTQQIKLYQPWKDKNDVNTPLRIRSRRIMQLASQEPKNLRKEKVKELYRTFPYHLLKAEPVKLRLKNFYFDRKVMEDNDLHIYKAADPENPNPSTDTLVSTIPFKPNRTISFEFTGTDEEHYYAVNSRNNTLSNVLHFVWQDEIEFNVKEDKPPNKWTKAAELVNNEGSFRGEEPPKIIFKSKKYLEKLLGRKLDEEEESPKPPKELTYTQKRKIKLRRRKGHFYKEVERMQMKHEILKLAGFFGDKEET